MLYEFIVTNRTEILERARRAVSARTAPVATAYELEHGLPIAFDDVVAIMRAGDAGQYSMAHDEQVAPAAAHGGEMLRHGLSVGQVVEGYGSICQGVTDLAHERDVLIPSEQYQRFNQCLDRALTNAVTGFEQLRDRAKDERGAEQLGYLAHELRNLLTTATLSFDLLRRGRVGIEGSAGMLLGRTLQRMRVLVDRTLTDVRLGAGVHDAVRVNIARLLEETAVAASLGARERHVEFTIETGDDDVFVVGDVQILAAVIANLVQNAFKFSRTGGRVAVRTRATAERVVIEVRDACGGLPPGKAEEMFRPFTQHASDRSGLGLGLAICKRGVEASHGVLSVRDLPGEGCVFTVDLPRG